MNDHHFIQVAIAEAKKASKVGEVPVGAIAVVDGKIIGRAHNIRERTKNPLGHAELLLLQKLVRKKTHPSWRLDNVTIYVTCEPCNMCMGALLQARVKQLVYGCKGSPYYLSRIETTSGIMETECAKLLSDFFRRLRNSK